jgi:hypothetical protein
MGKTKAEPKTPKEQKEKKGKKDDKDDKKADMKRKEPETPEESQEPTRADVSAMLGYMKYHKDSKPEIAEALAQYMALERSAKKDFYQLFKQDKSCKWIRTFKKQTTTSESSSSGFVEGTCNQFEIGKLEGIPTDHPQWQEMLDEICKDFECVDKNEKFPALSKFKYHKQKLNDVSTGSATNTVMEEETDVSKKKEVELTTPGVVIKEECPEYAVMMSHLASLNKKVGMVAKAMVSSRKILASFKAIQVKTVAMQEVDVDKLSQGLSAAAEFCNAVEDLAAVVKAVPCNNENHEMNGLIQKIQDEQLKGDAFLGAMQVAVAQLKDVMPKGA